jgi:hypothetical protein
LYDRSVLLFLLVPGPQICQKKLCENESVFEEMCRAPREWRGGTLLIDRRFSTLTDGPSDEVLDNGNPPGQADDDLTLTGGHSNLLDDDVGSTECEWSIEQFKITIQLMDQCLNNDLKDLNRQKRIVGLCAQ